MSDPPSAAPSWPRPRPAGSLTPRVSVSITVHETKAPGR